MKIYEREKGENSPEARAKTKVVQGVEEADTDRHSRTKRASRGVDHLVSAKGRPRVIVGPSSPTTTPLGSC